MPVTPRFAMAVGAYHEEHPDMPEDLPLCIYDRQERKVVATLHGEYAQLLCLETTGEDAPFSALESWLNRLGNPALTSEGIPPTKTCQQ